MARQGVFNRDITQFEQIKRSLQMLEHRHSTTLEYGVIIPNFTEFLYPNETLRLKTTNFLRTIPLKTPQLTRVRVVQRFIAFPIRLLWEFFPEYINALNPPKEGIPEEPYIVNFNLTTAYKYDSSNDSFSYSQIASIRNLLDRGYDDLSAMSIGNRKQYTLSEGIGSYGRRLHDYSGIGSSPAPLTVPPHSDSPMVLGYQFFPHELGDYLNMPLYSASLARDTSSRISAYKFAAYQLGYSFFYRRANVEERIDDWYEMQNSGYKDQLFSEYPAFYAQYDPDTSKLIPPVTSALSHIAAGDSRSVAAEKASPSGLKGFHRTDWAQDSDTARVRASTWENVEHFPLKAGPNICMQAKYVDSEGRAHWQDSTISLFRKRYAPWFMDRFTSANPWPQRGDESLIPVTGTIEVTLPDSTTVSFSNLSAQIPATPITNLRGITLADGSQSFEANTLPAIVDYKASVDDGGQHRHFLYLNGLPSADLNSNEGRAIATSPVSASISGSASASFSSSAANVAYSLSVSPSNFRFYMQLQHMKEMSGMTDGRYKSFLSMFFGSHDKDYRLDRPEFIGGFVQDLDVSEVTQTSQTSDSPLGTLAGKGISAKRGSTIQYHAFEHALVMGFLHIVPDSEYIGGLNIQDNTTDPFDWILPQFSGLSEQPIRMKELVCQPSKLSEAVNSDNNVVFGYEPRFNQRRARHSFVTGDFRDTMNSGGNYQYFKPWLITRNFGFDVDFVNATSEGVTYLKKLQFNVPSLSKEFVNMRHNVDYSNFSVTDPSLLKPFILDSYFEERLTAIIPRRGIPKI